MTKRNWNEVIQSDEFKALAASPPKVPRDGAATIGKTQSFSIGATPAPVESGVVERSCLVPKTVAGLLGEIARIANDYDLRDCIENIGDSFVWRECIEEADRLALATSGEVTEAMIEAGKNAATVMQGWDVDDLYREVFKSMCAAQVGG